MRLLALLAVRNEIRFIESVLAHLTDQGAEVAVIDNASTDGTREAAERWLGHGVVRIDDQPWTGVFELETQLRIKERLSSEEVADWYVHLDADERRYAPPPYPTLADGLADVGRRGWNAVDFDEFVFVPTAEDPSFEGQDFARAMRWYYHYEPDSPAGLRVNAWSRQDRVDLAGSGGHHVRFAGQRVFPRPFVLRHYPVLSEAHGREKYGRRVYAATELARSWHGDRAGFRAEHLRLPSRTWLHEIGPDGTLDPAEPWDRHPFLDPHARPRPRTRRFDAGRPERERMVRDYARRHRAHVVEVPVLGGGEHRPLWSVMLPVRDPRPEHLTEALTSVLDQDPGERMEIVVLDDASSTDVAAVVRAVGCGRVRYYGHDEPLGLAGNWNAAVAQARGHLVHLLHQDDRVLPGFYDRLGRALVADDALVGAYCRVSGFDDDGRITWAQAPERADAGVDPELALKEAETHRMIVAGVVLRRSTYETIGGYRDDLPYCTDWDLLKRATVLGPFWYDPVVLAHWRRHGGQETARLQATGADLVDRRKSIELTATLLPPELRSRVRSKALRSSLVWAVERLHELAEVDDIDGALAQAREIVVTLEARRADGDRPPVAFATAGPNRDDADRRRIAELEAQIKGWVAAVRMARSHVDEGGQ